MDANGSVSPKMALLALKKRSSENLPFSPEFSLFLRVRWMRMICGAKATVLHFSGRNWKRPETQKSREISDFTAFLMSHCYEIDTRKSGGILFSDRIFSAFSKFFLSPVLSGKSKSRHRTSPTFWRSSYACLSLLMIANLYCAGLMVGFPFPETHS